MAQSLHGIDTCTNNLRATAGPVQRVIVGEQRGQVGMHVPESRNDVGTIEVDDSLLVPVWLVGATRDRGNCVPGDHDRHPLLNRTASRIDHVGVGQHGSWAFRGLWHRQAWRD